MMERRSRRLAAVTSVLVAMPAMPRARTWTRTPSRGTTTRACTDRSQRLHAARGDRDRRARRLVNVPCRALRDDAVGRCSSAATTLDRQAGRARRSDRLRQHQRRSADHQRRQRTISGELNVRRRCASRRPGRRPGRRHQSQQRSDAARLSDSDGRGQQPRHGRRDLRANGDARRSTGRPWRATRRWGTSADGASAAGSSGTAAATLANTTVSGNRADRRRAGPRGSTSMTCGQRARSSQTRAGLGEPARWRAVPDVRQAARRTDDREEHAHRAGTSAAELRGTADPIESTTGCRRANANAGPRCNATASTTRRGRIAWLGAARRQRRTDTTPTRCSPEARRSTQAQRARPTDQRGISRRAAPPATSAPTRPSRRARPPPPPAQGLPTPVAAQERQRAAESRAPSRSSCRGATSSSSSRRASRSRSARRSTRARVG